ncbi:MAG: electron transfer flavoprotein subunit beta/FixA family protein [Bacteroidales bacterium]|nr:electron transfer flavoprotein subunit beta/FixA family protein [Bacteroidales bacterium]
MKILVCISNVPDTTTKIKLSGDKKSVDLAGVQWVINPWDELALTRAMELKEKSGGKIEKITAITVGDKICEPILRKALAVGADNAVRIDTIATDDYYVAAQIAEYVKKESFDMIFAGIESSDYNGSAVGSMLSEFLDIPSISSVSNVEFEGDSFVMKRTIDGGTETVNATLPMVAVVQKGIAIDPRIPAMRGIMMARKKPLSVEAPADIEAPTQFIEFEMPQPKPPVKMVDAENVAELFRLLHEEAKIL